MAPKELQSSSKSSGDAEQHTRQYGITDMHSHGKTHNQNENTLNFTGKTVKMVKMVNVQNS